MRAWVVAVALALMMLDRAGAVVPAAEPRPVFVKMDADRFQISGDGNAVTGLRRAPVPYGLLSDMTAAIRQPQAVPTAVRLERTVPPQVIDYVFCVTDDGLLVVGQQIRTLDVTTGQYIFTDGEIKRAYPALEATVPWTWIVDIPLAREVPLTLELKAMTSAWPVRAVAVTPSLR
jgi:hypothetical protein